MFSDTLPSSSASASSYLDSDSTSFYLPAMYNRIHTDASIGSYGSLYNFTAYSAEYNTKSYTTDGYNMPQDICPKNWAIATYANIRGVTSYTDLFFQTGSGFVGASGLDEKKTSEGWHTRTVHSATGVYWLHYSGSTLIADYHDSTRNDARSVRCVAKL